MPFSHTIIASIFKDGVFLSVEIKILGGNMFKLKQITYDINNVDADPFVEMVDGEFLTDKDTEAAAYNLAARYCEEYSQ